MFQLKKMFSSLSAKAGRTREARPFSLEFFFHFNFLLVFVLYVAWQFNSQSVDPFSEDRKNKKKCH